MTMHAGREHPGNSKRERCSWVRQKADSLDMQVYACLLDLKFWYVSAGLHCA